MSTSTAVDTPRLGRLFDVCTLAIAAHLVAVGGMMTRRHAIDVVRQLRGSRKARFTAELTQPLIDEELITVELLEGEEMLRASSLPDLAAWIADGFADRADTGIDDVYETGVYRERITPQAPIPRRRVA